MQAISRTRALSRAARPLVPASVSAPSVVQRRHRATALDPPAPTPGPAFSSHSPAPQLPPSASAAYGGADVLGLGNSTAERRSWKRSDVQKIYDGPLMDLIFRAATVHRAHHDPSKIQLCTLMNIKTGGCTEDCSYCAQSSRYSTGLKAQKLVDIEPVLMEARKAKENGSTRFCMGAAWRDMNGRKSGFKKILQMVKEVRGMGLEVCTTLGGVSAEQAAQLKEAGLTAYNHNCDTGREFYPKIITTRTFDDRLATIDNVRQAGISVCSGGIIGLGEETKDRVSLIWEMSKLPEAPESFPVNALVPIKGTPLGDNEMVSIHDLLRTIATARIILPTTLIRFAAGRIHFSESDQALAFMAGANSIFTGERMLTTPTSGWAEDTEMMSRWGLTGLKSFEGNRMGVHKDLPVVVQVEEVERQMDLMGEEQASQGCRKAAMMFGESDKAVGTETQASTGA